MDTQDTCCDDTLFSRFRGGDKRAGGTLVTRHYRAVYCFLRRKLASDVAEDVAQSTFEVLLRADNFRGDSSIRTYLFGVARLKLIQFLRQQQRQKRRFDPATDSLLDAAADQAQSPSSWVAERERENITVQALRALPLDDQLLIELKVYEGFTARALARIFEVPPGTIASRLARARGRLSKEVARLTEHASQRGEEMRRLESLMEELGGLVGSDLRVGDRD